MLNFFDNNSHGEDLEFFAIFREKYFHRLPLSLYFVNPVHPEAMSLLANKFADSAMASVCGRLERQNTLKMCQQADIKKK